MTKEEKLVLYFDTDEGGMGKLYAEASSNGFSGVGEAWFDKIQLLEFANALATYPLPSNNLPKIISGFWRKDLSGELDQEHIAISVYPIDGIGGLGVQIKLSTELWSEMRLEQQHFVKLEITTNYNAIEKFSKDFVSLINGQIEQAVLQNI